MLLVRFLLRTFSLGTELASPVNVRKRFPLLPSNLLAGFELTFSLTTIEAPKSRSTLSLANYIISKPIPEGWVLRCTTNDRVYFFNVKDSKPTATLWYDPLYGIAPRSKLEPLPPKWKRVSENGEIWYSPTLGAGSPATQALPESQKPMTFEHVLEPVQHHFPREFFVS